MIKVKVNYIDNKLNNISIKGHAMYEEYGKDIVCAAVSSLVISTINNINTLSKESIKVEDSSGIIIDIIKDDNITDTLLNNMIIFLEEIQDKYPKNIKITSKEE